jgi:chromosome segregation ATPase
MESHEAREALYFAKVHLADPITRALEALDLADAATAHVKELGEQQARLEREIAELQAQRQAEQESLSTAAQQAAAVREDVTKQIEQMQATAAQAQAEADAAISDAERRQADEMKAREADAAATKHQLDVEIATLTAHRDDLRTAIDAIKARLA